MSYIPSRIKTALRRAGFKSEGSPGRRKSMRECDGHIIGNGRRYRIRIQAGIVDIGEPNETFDRWANSTERSVPLEEFMRTNREKRRTHQSCDIESGRRTDVQV